MIRKSDLQSVVEEMNEEDRRRLGDPPTFEEMLAYTRGELSPEDEQRVRELLICYPELARTLTEPFAGEEEEGGRLLRFGPVWTAIAAALAIVFAGLYWQAESKARRLSHELTVPRVASNEQLLLPDGRRGPDTATTLSTEGDSYLLVATLINEARYPRYRLEITDASARSIWSRAGLEPRDNDTFAILVPRAFLVPGGYQVRLYGSGNQGEELVATFSVRVAK